MKKQHIVVLGGGTGTHTVLSGLKCHDVRLSAIVSTFDSGGSTGRLRYELGTLPAGDIRQCLVALSQHDRLFIRLMNQRYRTSGDLNGHNFGNLLISTLERTCKEEAESFEAFLDLLHGFFGIPPQHRVIPVSTYSSELVAQLRDGTTLKSEHVIDARISDRPPIQACSLEPIVDAYQGAIEALNGCDAIVIGPGDVYTSIIPVLLVRGIAGAIASSNAPILYVVNLATKPGQTDHYTALKHVQAVSSYIAPRCFDYIIVNTAIPDEALRGQYEREGEYLVVDDLTNEARLGIIRAPLISDRIVERIPQDQVERSLLRHDPIKLASTIRETLNVFINTYVITYS